MYQVCPMMHGGVEEEVVTGLLYCLCYQKVEQHLHFHNKWVLSKQDAWSFLSTGICVEIIPCCITGVFL